MSRGYILIEASITVIVISMAIAALLPVFILSLKAAKNLEKVAVAGQLSMELMEEIRLRKWDQNTPTPVRAISESSATLGPDSGENRQDKREFNDVDDFNGWVEDPPLDPIMGSLPQFSGFVREVHVRYVNSSLAPSSLPTPYKQVTVCTKWPKMANVCLDTLLTNH